MKCLKIEDNKGWYSLNEEDWISIDKINREDLLTLLTLCIKKDDFFMDEYKAELLGNQAHNIIYANVYSKFQSLSSNKSRFKDETEAMYRDSIEKYSKL